MRAFVQASKATYFYVSEFRNITYKYSGICDDTQETLILIYTYVVICDGIQETLIILIYTYVVICDGTQKT